MKVRALKSINQYFSIHKNEEYEVSAIVYFATPFFTQRKPTEIDEEELRGFINPIFSYGMIRNETVYIIKSKTSTGRTVLARFNSANFEVIDQHVPTNWSTAEIDLYEEVAKVKVQLQESGASIEPFIKPLEALKAFGAKIIVSGEPQLRSFEYLVKVCDDDLDDE